MERKKITKIFSVVLCFCIFFSSSVLASSGEININLPENNNMQIVNSGGYNPGENQFNEDGVNVSKIITPTNTENYFDITLNVKTPIKLEEMILPTNVVVVLDVSNTMNENNRLTNAKKALNKFVDSFFASSSLGEERKMGLVTFNSNAKTVIPLERVSLANKRDWKSKINNITASSGSDKFTNIEGGLQLAKNLLDTKKIKHQYIILITDGFPTTYISGNRNSIETIDGYDPYGTLYGYTGQTNPNSDGYFKDYVDNKLCSGTSYSNTAALKAENIAKSIKESANIFSVGVDIGGQTIKEYVDRGRKNGISIVERKDENYVIGGENNPSAYKNWLTNSIAGGGLLSSATKYFSADNEEEIILASETILSQIKEISKKSGVENPWIASDPMGEKVDFIGFYSKDNKLIKNKLIGEHGEDKENTASFSSNKISWVLQESGYKELIENGKTSYSYLIKYKVRLENEDSNFVEGNNYNTNGKTSLIYSVKEENGKITEKTPLIFPQPIVKGYLANLYMLKKSSFSDKPLSNATFTLEHYRKCSFCSGSVEIETASVTSNEEGKMQILNIPSGHEYILKEIEAPEYYEKTKERKVVVSYGETYVDNKEITKEELEIYNDPGDTPEPIEANISINKDIKGKELPTLSFFENQFAFKITPLNNSPSPEKLISQNDKEGKVNFGNIKFTKEGSYSYEIREINGSNLWDDENTVIKVNVEVTLPEKGEGKDYKLEAKVTYEGGKGKEENKIENTYIEPTKTNINFNIKKEVEGFRGDISALENKFYFSIIAVSGIDEFGRETNIPLPKATRVSNNNKGEVNFEEITYDKAGKYKYKVVEEETLDSSWEVKVKELFVEVNVVRDKENKLMANVNYYKEDKENNSFINKYTLPREAQLEITAIKKTEGISLKDNKFSFKLTPLLDSPGKEQIVKNDEHGNIYFEPIIFKEDEEYKYSYDETVKYFKYKIKEIIDFKKGILYDDKEVIVTVGVKKNENNEIVIEDVTYEKGGYEITTAIFENTLDSSYINNNSNIVDTSDSNNIVIWLILMIISGIGIYFIIKRNKNI